MSKRLDEENYCAILPPLGKYFPRIYCKRRNNMMNRIAQIMVVSMMVLAPAKGYLISIDDHWYSFGYVVHTDGYVYQLKGGDKLLEHMSDDEKAARKQFPAVFDGEAVSDTLEQGSIDRPYEVRMFHEQYPTPTGVQVLVTPSSDPKLIPTIVRPGPGLFPTEFATWVEQKLRNILGIFGPIVVFTGPTYITFQGGEPEPHYD
jgi:hypothetical protein